MIELAQQLRAAPGDKPAATGRSFFNQDYEGAARKTKLNWLLRERQYPFFKLHDGVGGGLDGEHDPDTVAHDLSRAVSEVLGFEHVVDAKPMERSVS